MEYSSLICSLSKPLEPVPTNTTPRLTKLENIEAVVFDVYGTLLISGSGDIGTAMAGSREDALKEAAHACNIDLQLPPREVLAAFHQAIHDEHARAKQGGADYPEVVIEHIWSGILPHLDAEQSRSLALQYELRVNPVWPMPGVGNMLCEVEAKGYATGIISNSQFFTPGLLKALLPEWVQCPEVDSPRAAWSWRERIAKPSGHLYRRFLDRSGWAPETILYVGNDMLNDILPAHSLGMKTGLFAGDSRSLRLRKEFPEVQGLEADVVLTAWSQMRQILA